MCCSVLWLCENMVEVDETVRQADELLLARAREIKKMSCCSVLQCVAVCCSVLQCSAVCGSVLQCVAV